jgi:nicotinamide riboside kinase
MKIGDKVRFLSAVGGGIVKRFQGKDIVLVEEEDGFETPVLIRECIIIESKETTQQVPVPQHTPTPFTPSTQEKEKNYIPEELSGKDKINACIAYLPEDIKKLGHGNYETYFINDSNYYLFINYMSCENQAWKSIYTGLIEPNTKLFLNEFSKDMINDLERICVQFIAFKKDKPFSLKKTYSVDIKIDAIKFYKLHCFRQNDFFEDDALIYPLVSDDVDKQELLISASDIQNAMWQQAKAVNHPKQPASKPRPENPVEEVDLHINHLLDTTSGMSNSDILEYQLSIFHQTLEKFNNKKGQKIVFIHGKGEGVLRSAILTALKTKYKHYLYQDASFKNYGFGATMVIIK